MSQQEFDNYIALLGRALRLSPAQRESIADELRDHMEQRLAELTERGVDREHALTIALEEFGDANALAGQFTQINHEKHRRQVMRYTLTTVSAACLIILVTMSILPERRDIPVGPSPVVAQGQPDAAKPAGPAPVTVDALLGEKKIVANFENNRFEDVIEYLRNVSGAGFFVNWKALGDHQVDADTSVTLSLPGTPAPTVLRLVLASAGGNDVPWDVSVDGKIIVISAKPLAAATEAPVAGQTARALHAKIEQLEFDLMNAELDIEASEIELKRQMQKLDGDSDKLSQTMKLIDKGAVTASEARMAERVLKMSELDVRTKQIDVQRAQIVYKRIKSQLNAARRSLEALSSGVLPLLGPGDRVKVSVYELVRPGEDAIFPQTVDAAGNIHLPVVGKVSVTGKTVDEVRLIIRESLHPQKIRDPRVNVTQIVDPAHAADRAAAN